MAKYGIRNFAFKLLGRYLIEDEVHLKAYEQLWMNNYKRTAVNRQAAFSVNAKQYARLKIQCECGSEIQRSSQSGHVRTKKHRQWEEKQVAKQRN